MKVQFLKFLIGIFLGVSSYGGVGGVSGGPSAAKFIQVQVCGHSEDSGRCDLIQIRNLPESELGKGSVTECVKMSGEILEYAPCSEETKQAIPEFLKKLWNKDRKPVTNNGEIGTWEN